MSRCDEQNVELAVSPDSVDETNGRFYGAFTFPWCPMEFDRALDPGFDADMLNQNIGEWSHDVVPHARAEADASVRRIAELCDGRQTVGEIFRELNVKTTVRAVNHARLLLTTSAFPYLKAVTAKSPALPDAGRSIKGARRALGRVDDEAGGVSRRNLMERG